MDSRRWLADLEQFGIKLGLDTIASVMAALGHPERAYPVVHIGGTNGKGSVAAMVTHALRASGRRTGTYTSPHLVHLEERFAIDGTPIGTRLLDAALDRIRETVTHLQHQGTLMVQPTYFEATTAAAFLVFAEAGIDAAVIEVGLGGRFDATNIVSPLVTAITSIDLDHQAQLGNTLAAIAREKAGIVKPDAALVVGDVGPAAGAVIDQAAALAGIVPAHVSDSVVEAQSIRGRYEVVIRTPVAEYGPLRLALAGRHQVNNAVVAVRVLEMWRARGHGLPHEAVVHGLTDARWPARLEWINTAGGRVLVDGAHNPAGARALASYLADAGSGPLPLVFGAMRDKDVDEMLAALAPWARPLVLTRASTTRAEDPCVLARHAAAAMAPHQVPGQPAGEIHVEPTLESAIARAREYGSPICIAGSLLLAGEALALLASPTNDA